jgi:hypothetical protein
MNPINEGDFKNLLVLCERILKERSLTQVQLKDEFDKFFNCIIQGKDIFNTYERRNAGITDEEWDSAKQSFYKSLGMIK